MALSPEQQVALLENAIRTIPDADHLRSANADVITWLGDAQAIMESFGGRAASSFATAVNSLRFEILDAKRIHAELLRSLSHARSAIKLTLEIPTGIAVMQGNVHDYFEGLRRLVELATVELLFVDPYLNADFVARYLPSARKGVRVRLLGRNDPSKLVPAVSLFAKQHGVDIEVRTSDVGMHDRFLFIDQREGYQSGISFSDGGARAPTAINQITVAFPALIATYEDLWQRALVRYPTP